MSDSLREGRVTDMFKNAASGLGNFFGKSNKTEEPAEQGSSTTNQPSNQSAVKQPSNQNDATTASKQAKGTSADKGGGRVQPKAGLVDVRRATYGKMMLALQTAGITDQQKQKEYAEQIITNIIIPFLTVHLNARGLNVTDLRSKKSSLSQNSIKDQSGNPRVVTLSEKKAADRTINQSNNTQQTPEQKEKSEKQKEFRRARDQERVAAKQSRSTNDNSSKDAEENVEDPPTNPGQETESLKNYSSQLNKIDKKVFPKELGKNPVLILSKLFASNPELAKEFGFKQEIKEAIDNEIGKNYRGDQINDQPAKLLKALEKQGIKINIIQAKSLTKSIISLNPQQVKSAKQVNRSPNQTQQQASPAETDEKKLKDVRAYMESKAGAISKATDLTSIYKIIDDMPETITHKKEYRETISIVMEDPAIANSTTFTNIITSGGGFRDKVVELAKIQAAKTQPQAQQSNQPAAAQAPVALIPTTPEAQAIVKTKIDINQPIPLFTGNASLLQRINTSIKSRAKGVNVNDPNIQNQFKQIIKDLVDQLKINGITNKQIQENFDFTQELLNETIVNRWKLLANIK